MQLEALKHQIRDAASGRDAEIQAAQEPLLAQIKELQDQAANHPRMESSLRSARMAASQYGGQVQVKSCTFAALRKGFSITETVLQILELFP